MYVVRIFLAPAALCIFENMNYWPGKVPKPFICSLELKKVMIPLVLWGGGMDLNLIY